MEWSTNSLNLILTSQKRGRASEDARPNFLPGVGWSLTYDKQVAGVLGIDLPIAAQGSRCVGRAQGPLLKDILLECAALVDRIEIAILTVLINYSITVNHMGINKAFEGVGVI